MTNKLSYMHKVCTGKIRFLDSSDILFHFLRRGPPHTASFYSPLVNSQPYHSDTRWFVIVPDWRADFHPGRRFVCFMVGL